jgi:hypothetical protein
VAIGRRFTVFIEQNVADWTFHIAPVSRTREARELRDDWYAALRFVTALQLHWLLRVSQSLTVLHGVIILGILSERCHAANPGGG